MNTPTSEFEELRLGLEQLRTLLENLVVRGLRACGTEELMQLRSFTEYLERAGAGHVASLLGGLQWQIEQNSREAARSLLQAQTRVRLLERLLTLRMVRGQFTLAVEQLERACGTDIPADIDDTDDGDGG
jgi:hypothetical protein